MGFRGGGGDLKFSDNFLAETETEIPVETLFTSRKVRILSDLKTFYTKTIEILLRNWLRPVKNIANQFNSVFSKTRFCDRFFFMENKNLSIILFLLHPFWEIVFNYFSVSFQYFYTRVWNDESLNYLIAILSGEIIKIWDALDFIISTSGSSQTSILFL